MKIYTSNQRYKLWQLIDKYIGKDVWVKCHYFSDGRVSGPDVYANILKDVDIYGKHYLMVKMIYCGYIDELNGWNIQRNELEEWLKPRVVPYDELDVVFRPAEETYTDEEMMDFLNSRVAD